MSPPPRPDASVRNGAASAGAYLAGFVPAGLAIGFAMASAGACFSATACHRDEVVIPYRYGLEADHERWINLVRLRYAYVNTGPLSDDAGVTRGVWYTCTRCE